MKTIWKAATTAVCVGTLTFSALGGPVLLGQTGVISAGGTWSTGVTEPLTITGMQFYISYQYPFTIGTFEGGTYDEIIPSIIAQSVGGSLTLTNGQTGTFDFPVTNGVPFGNVIAGLTDGTNETTFVGGFGFNSAGFVTGGEFSSGTEAGVWGFTNAVDLAGNQLAFFRLIVTQVYWGPASGGGFEILGNAQWQVYGTQQPPGPAPVILMIPAPLNTYFLVWPASPSGYVLQSTTNLASAFQTINGTPIVSGTNNIWTIPLTGAQHFYRLFWNP